MCIRFHFWGTFVTLGHLRLYIGGDIEESWVELEELSLKQVKGLVAKYYETGAVIRVYWSDRGKDPCNDYSPLLDDASCVHMYSKNLDTKVVDMYSEEIGMEISADEEEIWADEDCGDEDAGYAEGGK